ncbi:hypothetical protein G9A89_006552 [Geosiphon pyriformis]|nr:hypothetical protein G9A89_006552 [Geosiphon pyriformis]
MKKVAKDSGAGGGFGPVLSRKKRKGGVLAESVLVRRGVIKTTKNHSQNFETGNTIKFESVDMEEECLIEETSIDYGERNTKKVLGKPLGKINFEDGFDNGDFLDESALFPPPLLLKPSVHVSVRKFFTLDIDLVAVAEKSSQKKLNFIKKIFSGVNSFGEASTLSKFGKIIHVTFTSEMAMMVAGKLAYDCDVMVNTNLKHPVNNCTNRNIVIKEIPVGTSIETVRAAVSEFGVVVSIKMQKDAVRVVRADVDKQTWNSRDEFKALLYTFSVGTNTHDLWDFIGLVGGKTCVIEHNSVNYTWAYCTTVCFESENNLNWALANTLVINDVRFHWLCLFAVLCSSCNFLGHTSRNLIGSIPSGTSLGYNSQLGSIRNGKPLPPVVNDLEKRLVSIKSSLVSLTEQIGELAKRLKSFMPAVSQSSPGWEDIVMGVDLGDATSDKTAAVSGSTASPKIVKLKNMLENLSASVISLLVCLDGLALADGAPFLPLS